MGFDTRTLRRLMPITLALLSASMGLDVGGGWITAARADDTTYSPDFTRVEGDSGDNGSSCGKSGRGGSAPPTSVSTTFNSAITGYAGGQSQGGNGGNGRDSCTEGITCLLYTSPSPRDKRQSRMPSSA